MQNTAENSSPNPIFWPRARSEAVLVKCLVLFVSYFGQKVSCSIRKPKSLILHEKLGKSHLEWEYVKISSSMRKLKSLILHEKSENSHPAWEIGKVSSCMRRTKNFIMFYLEYFIMFKSISSCISLDWIKHVQTGSNLFKLDQNGSNFFKLDQTCLSLIKLD